jgi:hypothetical protein
VTFTACNQGTVPTTGSGVEFYQSPDATITLSDMRLGGVPLPSLAEGECITRDAPGVARRGWPERP